MFFIRPIQRHDLDAVLALSEHTGAGLTSLPANADRLAAFIGRSVASFAGEATRADECYMFALVDAGSGNLVGVSGIEAAVGLREPWYNYHVGTQVHASRELDVYTAAPTLFLSNDHTGCSELCSLFVDVRYRRGKNGSLLSKSRLLFVADFAERFAPKLIADLRGRSNEEGKSPFWEGLGRHFFAMDYSRADYLTGLGDKSFIAELMPRHPVYTVLLPADARAVIGEVHDATIPARALLESEGFRYEGYVDIFDAGPTVECFRDDVRLSRRSQLLPVSIGDAGVAVEDPAQDVDWLVSNRRYADFVALLCRAPRRPLQLALLPHQARTLGVHEGDVVRAVPLSPRDRV